MKCNICIGGGAYLLRISNVETFVDGTYKTCLNCIIRFKILDSVCLTGKRVTDEITILPGWKNCDKIIKSIYKGIDTCKIERRREQRIREKDYYLSKSTSTYSNFGTRNYYYR